MRLILNAFILLAFLAVNLAAQSNDPISRNETYIGFTHQRNDNGVDFPAANGFSVAYTRNVSRYLGVKGEFTATFDNDTLDVSVPPATLTLGSERSTYSILGGIQIKDNTSTARFKPFGHALAGVGFDRVTVTCSPAAACAPAPAQFRDNQTAFSGAFGGGLDIRINDRFDVRVIQADYNPVYNGDFLRNNFRFGAGIIIK